jgi:hypothetical protein
VRVAFGCLLGLLALTADAAADEQVTISPAISRTREYLHVYCDSRQHYPDGGWACALARDFAYRIVRAKGQLNPVNIMCGKHGPRLALGHYGPLNAMFHRNDNLERCTPEDDFNYDLAPWQTANGGRPDVNCRMRGEAWFYADGQLRVCTSKGGRFAAQDGTGARLYDCRGTVVFGEDGSLQPARSECQAR